MADVRGNHGRGQPGLFVPRRRPRGSVPCETLNPARRLSQLPREVFSTFTIEALSELRADSTVIKVTSFPGGYGLFSRSSKNGRQDRYLRGAASMPPTCETDSDLIPGSRYVKQFRSPTEFAPHAAWLLTDPLLDPLNCECRHCSARGGRHQNSRHNSASVRSTTPQVELHHSPITSPRIQRYASNASSPARRSTPSWMTQRSLRGVSREASLCEVFPQLEKRLQYVSSSVQLSDLVAYTQGRIYRDQELVWYILDKPWQILEHSSPEVNRTISLWPGILRTTFCPSPHGTNLQQSTEDHQIFYLITTLTLGRTYTVPRASIIPFQAHLPDENLLVELQSKGAEASLNDPDRGFDPLPRSSTLFPSLSSGTESETSPLNLLIADIKVAMELACIWTVTDGFSVYPGPAETIVAPGSSALPNASPRSGKTLAKSSSFRSTSREQVERKYRGLWWGAERIWLGDFLVLSFSESMMGYTATSSPYFIRDTPPEDPFNDLPAEQRKSQNKHVFLKLSSLDKVGGDICAVGTLYKLVPSLDSVTTHQEDDKTGLPHPPNGYTFRSMLSTNVGAKIPMKLVRGRYYPRLHLLVDGEQLVPDECMLRTMEGRSHTDPGIRRPTKYRWEPRGNLLASVCPIGF